MTGTSPHAVAGSGRPSAGSDSGHMPAKVFRLCPGWRQVALIRRPKRQYTFRKRAMSAVSSGSPQGSAEVRQPVASREPGPNRQPASAPQQQGAGHDPGADFGANEWLVEELYQRYLADPGSVDRAWWSFFADYSPALSNGTGPQPVLNVTATDRAGVRELRPAPGPQGAPQAPAPQAPAPQAPAPRRLLLPRLRRPPRRRRPQRLPQPRPRRRPRLRRPRLRRPRPRRPLPRSHQEPRSAGCAAPPPAPPPT